MKKTVTLITTTVLLSTLISFTSCKKEYRKYDNKEVVQNTYTGNIFVTSGGQDPGGDFTGDGDSGTYSFVWENPQNKASVNFDVTTSAGGSVQVIVNDAKGVEVLNETRPNGADDTFSGVTQEGKKGKWLITIKLTHFDGDGSYSIHPGS